MYSNNYTLKSKWEGLSFYARASVMWLSLAPQPPWPQKPSAGKCTGRNRFCPCYHSALKAAWIFGLLKARSWGTKVRLSSAGERERGKKREREGEGGREREILVFDSEQKLLLQHWLEICNQLKSGKVFWKFILKYLNLDMCAPTYMYIFKSSIEKTRNKAFVIKILPVVFALKWSYHIGIHFCTVGISIEDTFVCFYNWSLMITTNEEMALIYLCVRGFQIHCDVWCRNHFWWPTSLLVSGLSPLLQCKPRKSKDLLYFVQCYLPNSWNGAWYAVGSQ